LYKATQLKAPSERAFQPSTTFSLDSGNLCGLSPVQSISALAHWSHQWWNPRIARWSRA